MGLGRYLRAAFSARPLGMPIPLNWIGLAGFALLGLVHPGLWLVGLGIELLYLWMLVANPRFRNAIDTEGVQAASADLDAQRRAILARLEPAERRLHEALEGRCLEAVRLHRERAGAEPAVAAQADALARLAWVHLRLLDARAGLNRLLLDGEPVAGLEAQLAQLTGRRAAAGDDDLRASLAAQAELLTTRIAGLRDGERRLAYIDAEVERLRQQAELAREEALAAPGAAVAARSLDALGEAVRSAQTWVSEDARSAGVADGIAGPAPALPQPQKA